MPDACAHGDAPVPLILKAGQMSLHSDWILHSSEVNRSNRRRCGLAMRYLSSDVRAYNGWNQHSVVCRGTQSDGHWADHPRPDGEHIPRKSEQSDLASPGWADQIRASGAVSAAPDERSAP